MSKTLLVTGCSQGIGLQLVKYYVKKGFKVIATCRNPSKATELLSVGAFAVEPLDVTSDESIDALSKKLGAELKLDMLINNAGILSEDTFTDFKKQDVVDQFMTNSVAPLMLTRAFYPNLKNAVSDTSSPMIVNISSILGSMSQNSSGGYYGYRASKCAINAISKSMAVDFASDGICVCIVHPGWVKTNMTSDAATLTPEQSVSGIAKVIDQMDLSKSGTFYHSNGRVIEW